MIAQATSVNDFKETPPTNEFQVQPPKANSLVAASGLSLVNNEGKVDIEWPENEMPVPTTELVNRVKSDIIDRARKLVTKYPKSSRAHANLGIALLSQGQREEAQQELEFAIGLDEDNYVSFVTLARMMVDSGKLDEAERIYRRALQRFPHQPAPSLSLAFIAMRRGAFAQAKQMLRRVVDLDPENTLAKHLLAMVLIRQGENRAAIKLLKQAVRSDVRSPALYHSLGVAYAMSEDFTRAETAFRSALALAPNMRRAVHGLARVLLNKEDPSAALEVLTDYLEVAGGDLEARQLLGRAYIHIEQYRSAAVQYTRVYEALAESNTPDDVHTKAELANDIGMCLGFDHKDKEAEVWFRRSISLEPTGSATPYQNLGRAYFRLSRDAEALQVLLECKRIFPEDQENSLLIAVAYQRQGMYAEGIRELKSVLQRGEAKAEIYSYLACLFDYVGELDEALGYLREGISKYPEHDSIIHNLIYVLLMKGQVAEGRALLERHHELLENEAVKSPAYKVIFTATWGLLHILEGDFEGGSKCYKQAAKIGVRAGYPELAHEAIQKMHLELARRYLAMNDVENTRKQVLAGLLVKKGRPAFRDQLERIKKLLPA